MLEIIYRKLKDMKDINNVNNEPEQLKNFSVSGVVLGSVGDINNKNIVLGDGETPSLKNTLH